MTTKTTNKFDRDAVSHDDIRSLMDDAGEHGDTEQVELCRRALEGDIEAAEACIDALESAWAMAD